LPIWLLSRRGHQPGNIAAIGAIAAAWPGLPQAACFDTAFHLAQPRLARMFGLPRAFDADGVVRYGFHGLSYEYIAGCMSQVAGIGADARWWWRILDTAPACAPYAPGAASPRPWA
jgi:acetate kinase